MNLRTTKCSKFKSETSNCPRQTIKKISWRRPIRWSAITSSISKPTLPTLKSLVEKVVLLIAPPVDSKLGSTATLPIIIRILTCRRSIINHPRACRLSCSHMRLKTLKRPFNSWATVALKWRPPRVSRGPTMPTFCPPKRNYSYRTLWPLLPHQRRAARAILTAQKVSKNNNKSSRSSRSSSRAPRPRSSSRCQQWLGWSTRGSTWTRVWAIPTYRSTRSPRRPWIFIRFMRRNLKRTGTTRHQIRTRQFRPKNEGVGMSCSAGTAPSNSSL